MSIAANIASIRDRIASAAARAGRDSDDIRLMAVTKTHPAGVIEDAYAAGLRLFGENRVQEFAAKADKLTELKEATFHLIGHLQSNKARKAAEVFSGVQSVDSLGLAERLNAAAEELSKTLDVLVEINIGGEAAKSGLDPYSPDLEALLEAAPDLTSLRFNGLMTIPPFGEKPEDSRFFFRKLRQLRDTISARELEAVSMKELSMGMSHDFEVAIEEGSTCVRIGTALFGERPMK
jgi:pyridoxal phosphate enzyme (YggS family)